MHAAVVSAFGEAPRYTKVEEPVPGDDEVLVDILAAGLHPLVRSVAAGTHYSSGGKLPLVPGFDAVGRTVDGSLVYLGGMKPPHGSMAERVAFPASKLIPVPAGLDPVTVAAAMNPGMSAWIPLHDRADLERVRSVLVLGATGSAGQMALQLARHFGIDRIVAAGRSPQVLATLPDLGAHEVVSLEGDDDAVGERIARAAADTDLVIDYLWGWPAELTLASILGARRDPAHLLRWVQVGGSAGGTITLPAASLRSANVDMCGSGLGSISPAGIQDALRALLAELPSADLRVATSAVPLADVEAAWNAPVPSGTRVVFTN